MGMLTRKRLESNVADFNPMFRRRDCVNFLNGRHSINCEKLKKIFKLFKGARSVLGGHGFEERERERDLRDETVYCMGSNPHSGRSDPDRVCLGTDRCHADKRTAH